MRTVGIRFRPAGKVYTFDAADLELNNDDRVVVETERGMAIGFVAWAPVEADTQPPFPVKKILRPAEERDIDRAEENKVLEKEARSACVGLIQEKKLDMKLLTVEMLFDRSKMVFFFASEGRVDFRELVRDLARHFHTRIEMRQVGVRDEAKMVGGLGCCGRELCCATWMHEFAPISVRMAKSQNISLNPAKISGICGRLMCCLSFENKMYEQLSKDMPKVGKRVMTPKGEGKVVRRNALEGTFVVFTNEGEVEIAVDEFRGGVPEPPQLEEKKERPPEERGRRQRPATVPEEGAEADGGEEEPEAVEGESEAAREPGAEGGAAKSQNKRRRRRRKRPSQDREKKTDG